MSDSWIVLSRESEKRGAGDEPSYVDRGREVALYCDFPTLIHVSVGGEPKRAKHVSALGFGTICHKFCACKRLRDFQSNRKTRRGARDVCPIVP